MPSVFEAVADPTRRGILARLRSGDALSVSDIAAELPMTRQAVTKHLDLLRDAGLIHVRWRGRERLHELDARPLREVDEWLEPYSAFWDDALGRLERHLKENP
ncbi:MAG: metalloregulator ArsR/SmtB family transcription factor [Thermoanaerobaculia bacterium]|nr:metalloregulator ArsR/SmtB family transcription factor [Thermoanaerobaculia bacterium]